MSLELDPKCKARLIEFTSAALGDVKTVNGKFLDDKSGRRLIMADIQTLPKQGALRERLNTYISETPFSDFVRESLARELYERQIYTADDTLTPLCSATGYSDLGLVAIRLVEDFASLPWKYELTLVLPDAVGIPMLASLGPMDFCPSVRLVALDDAFKDKFALDSGGIENLGDLLGLVGATKIQWPAGQAALQISVSGFIGHFAQTEPVREALRKV